MKRFSQLIAKERIVDLKGKTKQDVLKKLVDVIATAEVTDKDDFFISTMKREEIMSTGVGAGIA